VSYHPTHPGWRRLLDDILALDQQPGDPVALMGLDDADIGDDDAEGGEPS